MTSRTKYRIQVFVPIFPPSIQYVQNFKEINSFQQPIKAKNSAQFILMLEIAVH